MRRFVVRFASSFVLGLSQLSAFAAEPDEATPVLPPTPASSALSAGPVPPPDGATVDLPIPVVPQPVCVVPGKSESYDEISERYPAPARSLVPAPLMTGPRFWESGNPGGATTWGVHLRYPYYNYRSPWTYGGPASVNHTIHW